VTLSFVLVTIVRRPGAAESPEPATDLAKAPVV